jgi:hypothetical protein
MYTNAIKIIQEWDLKLVTTGIHTHHQYDNNILVEYS